MKRNKHHGLNVEFDGLCMDFGHVSLNKKKEFLCGDCYKIEENDKDHVLVLSDGLGSGVKANILSTLTATMLSTMIINQVELDEAVRAVAKTLPVCSVRNLAYATFTVLNFQGKQVSLYQFDNPDAILIRDGELFDYPVETSMIEEKEIHKSCFELKDEDMLIIMSDGVTNAGMGKTTNGGWGRDDVMAFCRAKYHKGMSAQEIFKSLVPELVFAGYADGNPHYDKNEDAFHVSCASYMLCKKYGIDTSRYDFSHAPEFFERMETQEVRAELSRARDAANAISARMAKVLDQNRNATYRQSEAEKTGQDSSENVKDKKENPEPEKKEQKSRGQHKKEER